MSSFGSLSGAVVVESLVAVLLVANIGFCAVLNGRLRRLRADEASLRKLVANLAAISDRAERSIESLRDFGTRAVSELTPSLRQASTMKRSLDEAIAAGRDVLYCIGKVVGTANSPRPPMPSVGASNDSVPAANHLARRIRNAPEWDDAGLCARGRGRHEAQRRWRA